MVPSYFISTNEDHVALWQGTYTGAVKLAGKTTFVLGGSGHIAGIINPPAKNKYEYWVNDQLCESAEEWLEGAEHHDGSWWPHWNSWLSSNSEETLVPPYPQGSTAHPVLAPAPGEYVRQRLPIMEEEEAVEQQAEQ